MNNCNRRGVVGGLLLAVIWGPLAYAASLSSDIGRDPFQPVSAVSCNDGRENLATWQLQGIVRGEDYHSGWVKRPEGQWQKVVITTQLLPDWQVTHISASERQVILQHANPDSSCSEGTGAVVLSMR